MRKFLFHTVLYIFLLVAVIFILALLSSKIVSSRKFHNWDTESNLLIIGSQQNYDLVFLGISHARNFSRHKNHQRMEKILGKKILNLGRGSSLIGTSDLDYYLQYFYNQKNTCDTILYFLSPSMMFAKFLNEASNSFVGEPFVPSFFLRYLEGHAENKFSRLFYYVSSKFSSSWITMKPFTKDSMAAKLDSLDHSKIKAGMTLAYLDGKQKVVFTENCDIIRKTIARASEHGSKMIFVIPPAIFGKWKGHNESMDFLKEMKKEYGIDYFDLSESVLEPRYYYDHHHLNTDGVEYFTENYLKPIIDHQ